MLNINTVAYGSIVLGGLALFAIGHPKADAPPSLATPGLAVAGAAPAAGSQPASAPAILVVQAAAAPAAAVTASAVPVSAAAAPSVSGNGFTLASLSMDLPSSDRAFPPGPGVEENCAACHSPGMILNQPSLARPTWETEVYKMIAVYKAPVSDVDA